MSHVQSENNIATIMELVRKEFLAHLAEKHNITAVFTDKGEIKLDEQCGREERVITRTAWCAWISATELSLLRQS